jgi:hypothetical protein
VSGICGARGEGGDKLWEEAVVAVPEPQLPATVVATDVEPAFVGYKRTVVGAARNAAHAHVRGEDDARGVGTNRGAEP